ncbi:protoporphyrinogen oxidase [Lujinxingia litoralis]|uniref:Coproporphyrinogen III oxidase n=1 Tax=Lujinxingia litoralis TaxID=2211119 RepID=A0A328CBT5_9DELT|nr:protoporphyrinogen oxidase [Lujinxingia litoralis]RAL25354.1 protoporphyrinogen oxidase [Lujinxingia litoralis]
MSKHIAILGAGISGLSIAYALEKAGLRVTLFEAREHVGGPLRSSEREGFVVEHGPHTLLQRSAGVAALLSELGLDDQIVDAFESASRRYVVRYGRALALPSSPAEFLKSELLSPAAKLRLLGEPFVSRFDRPHIDETLAGFVRRRLGPEALDYLLDPFVGGTYAGDPHQMSARHTFPVLKELEDEAGSLLLGGVRRQLRTTRSETPRAPKRLLSFSGGLQTLTDALAAALEGPIHLGHPVTGLRRTAAGWQVLSDTSSGPADAAFDALVSTLPPYALADLRWEHASPPPAPLQRVVDVPFAPITLVATGFKRPDVAHPLDGFGVLNPRVEELHTLGTLFTSSMFPQRAPRGSVNLTTFVGGARQPALARLDDQAVVELVKLDLRRILGVRAEPHFVHISRWEKAIPQFEVGHQLVLNAYDTLEDALPGLFFAGNTRDTVALPALLDAREHHARRVTDFLNLT